MLLKELIALGILYFGKPHPLPINGLSILEIDDNDFFETLPHLKG